MTQTERTDAPAAGDLSLTDLRARYAHMCEIEGFGYWCWDIDGDRFETYGKLWRQLGYNTEELDRICVESGFKGFVHPDDEDLVLDDVRVFLSTKRRLDITYRVLTKDGSSVWVQSRGDAEWDDSGRAHLVYGSITDVSELISAEDALRESEARHYRIIDASNDGIWEWYAEGGGYFHFSARCWDQLGYTDEDDELNEGQNRFQAWCSLIHPEDLRGFQAHIEHYWKTLERMDIEYRIRAKDGNYRWIRARGKGVLAPDGTPWRMSGTNIDITEIKAAEEKVLKAKELAENANKAKSAFLSSMSHELRTPLNAILGFTQLFDFDNNLSADQRENIREIRKAGNHLLQLINDVLDLSKIEAGRISLSLEPVLPERVAEECLSLVRPLAAQHRVGLKFLPGDYRAQYVNADAVRLKQTLLNLLSNAIKYNREGGFVALRFERNTPETLALVIEDNGRGIAAADLQQMYEPFNRLGAERSNIEGSGVGLLITKHLVEMMGGALHCVSEENIGSIFTIELPATEGWQKQTEADIERISSGSSGALELAFTTPRRVLYVEDNRSNIRVMEQLFARFQQLSLEVAEEPFLGLYKARCETPDLIIMDINLPGIDGFEALAVLQNDPSTKHVPVVALSANAMSYDIERGIRAGFYTYLTKPVDVAKLVAVFNAVLADK